MSSALAACTPAASTPTTAPAPAPKTEATSAPAKPADQSATAPTQAPAKPATQPGTKGPVEIRTHDWQQDPDDAFYGPFWAKFEQEHPNIKIKREWFPRGDMHTKILSLAATNQLGDTVRINVAPLSAELRLKGVIQPLDPYIRGDQNWAENDHKQFWPGNLATYTHEGQQWGYPIVGHPGCIHYYYNIDHLESVGAPLPPGDLATRTFDMTKWKVDDLIAVVTGGLKTGSDGRVTTYGIQPCLGGEGAVAALRMFGGDYYSEDGTKCLINTPESVAGIEFLASLWHTHKAAIPLETNPNYQETFPSGRTAVVVLTAVAGTLKNIVGDKFQWSVAPPPIGPTGKPETQVSSDGIGLSKSTQYPDEAWEVIKAYVSKEHGVERHLHGLGSPGSRYDVWTDPKFQEQQPLLSTIIYDNLIDPQKAPPLRPWHHPANGRYFEADTAMNNILQEVWLGQKQPKEAADEAFSAVQAIMDMPPA